MRSKKCLSKIVVKKLTKNINKSNHKYGNHGSSEDNFLNFDNTLYIRNCLPTVYKTYFVGT